MWIYIGLLVALAIMAIVGQVAYTRSLQSAGIAVPKSVRVVRMVNLGLLAVTLAAVIIYLALRS